MRNIEAAIFPGIDLMRECARGPALVVDVSACRTCFSKRS